MPGLLCDQREGGLHRALSSARIHVSTRGIRVGAQYRCGFVQYWKSNGNGKKLDLFFNQAITDVLAGKDIDYQGASGPIDFTAEGDPAGLYDVYSYTNGKIVVDQTAVAQS